MPLYVHATTRLVRPRYFCTSYSIGLLLFVPSNRKVLICLTVFSLLFRVGAELAKTAAEEGTDDKFLWTSRITSLKVSGIG